MKLITMQFGTPLAVQSSLSKTYCLVSCPTASVHVWACTFWLSLIGLTCLLSLLWLSFHSHVVF